MLTLEETSTSDVDEEEISKEEIEERTRWLVAGAKDNRVSIWTLMTFGATS